MPTKIPCGPFRAPGSNTAAWVVQSFLHEVSTAAGKDHGEFLIELFGHKQRLLRRRRVVSGGGWRWRASRRIAPFPSSRPQWSARVGAKRCPKGHYHGMAFHFSHQGHFAEVAEISVDKKNKVTLHKMTVVGDIGPIVNLSVRRTRCRVASSMRSRSWRRA